jgi:hypothetical protein
LVNFLQVVVSHITPAWDVCREIVENFVEIFMRIASSDQSREKKFSDVAKIIKIRAFYDISF